MHRRGVQLASEIERDFEIRGCTVDIGLVGKIRATVIHTEAYLDRIGDAGGVETVFDLLAGVTAPNLADQSHWRTARFHVLDRRPDLERGH